MKKMIKFLLLFCLFNCCSACYSEEIKIYADDETFRDLKSRGYKFSSVDNAEEAIPIFEKALKIYSDDLQILSEYCACLEMKKDYDKLITVAQKALAVAQRKGVKDYIGRFYGCMGKAYHAKKDYKTAIKYATLAIPNKMYNAQIYYHERAVCYSECGEYSKAIEDIKYLINFYPDYVQKYNVKGLWKSISDEQLEKEPDIKHSEQANDFYEKGDFKSAKSEALKSLESNPKNVVALEILIKIAKKNNDYQEAISYANKLEELTLTEQYKNNIAVRITAYSTYADCYKELGESDKAAEYDAKFKFYDQLYKALKYMLSGNYDESIKEFEEVLKIEPENLYTLERFCFTLIDAKKFDRAKEILKIGTNVAKKQQQKEKLVYFSEQIGRLYSLNGEPEKEIKYIKYAAENSDVQNTKLKNYYMLYLIEGEKGNMEACKEYLSKCSEAIENGAEDIYDITSRKIECNSMLDENSDFNKANKHFQAAMEYIGKEKYHEASQELKIALQYIPQELKIMNALMSTLHLEGKKEEAFAVAQEAYRVSFRDNNTDYMESICINLGNYYCGVKEDFETALTYYNNALKFNPKSAEACCHIGLCYASLERQDKALIFIGKAIQLDPTNEDYPKILEELK